MKCFDAPLRLRSITIQSMSIHRFFAAFLLIQLFLFVIEDREFTMAPVTSRNDTLEEFSSRLLCNLTSQKYPDSPAVRKYAITHHDDFIFMAISL